MLRDEAGRQLERSEEEYSSEIKGETTHYCDKEMRAELQGPGTVKGEEWGNCAQEALMENFRIQPFRITSERLGENNYEE